MTFYQELQLNQAGSTWGIPVIPMMQWKENGLLNMRASMT